MGNQPPAPEFERQVEAFARDYDAIAGQVGRVIVGHDEAIHQVLACLLTGGHALLEGVPGIGKTLLVRTLAAALDVSFQRIQFTPDLMPADITGATVLVDGEGGKRFEFQPGPIFAHLVLADEINRATPKTQSAVLEAMQERTVSIARTSHPLAEPFMVMATQNPLEMEGTYPLPEAQLDRFALKVCMAAPGLAELSAIVDRTTGSGNVDVAKAVSAERVLEMRAVVRRVALASAVREAAARIVLASHPHAAEAPPAVRQAVRYGASPRAAQAIVLTAKVAALRQGRANVAIDDLRAAAAPAMRHRLILTLAAQADEAPPDRLVDDILHRVLGDS